MRSAIRLRILVVAILLLAALAGLWMSRLDFAVVKEALDARSADGDVESYDAALHALIQERLVIAVVALVLIAAAVVLFRRGIDRMTARMLDGARSFRSDVTAGSRELWKSVGRAEVIAVMIVLLSGVMLRGLLLRAPVIYDEAFTCTYYAVRPVLVIVSDYSYPNNHILHTLLVKAGLAVFGWGEGQARLPAFAAGAVAMLLSWLWMRSAFGPGAALVALALVAVSGALIEYSALGRGYSMTWVALLTSLILARQLLRSGDRFTAVLLALVNALGVWTVPTMIYGSAMVYLWTLVSLRERRGSLGRSRTTTVILSLAFFILLTLLFYAPVIVTYGPGRLFYHETMGPRSWAHFSERACGEILAVRDQLQLGVPAAGRYVLTAAVPIAMIVSRAYRRIIVVLLIAVVPLVFLQHMIGPPRIWSFLLFILLPAVPIAIQGALQRVQPVARASDRQRTFIFGSAGLLVLALAVPRALPSSINRFPGAREAAQWFTRHLQPTDRVLVNVPCEAPLEFYFREYGLGIEPLYREPVAGGRLWFVTGTDYEHTFDALAARARLPRGSWSDPRPVRDLDRMAIFAASYALAP